MQAGMLSLGHVSLDGSKFKANISKHKAMSYGRLKAKEKELSEEKSMRRRESRNHCPCLLRCYLPLPD